MSTVKSIEQEIAKTKKTLENLEEQLLNAKSESPDQQLAKVLHSKLCHWNHTDGCGWYYEMNNGIDDWTRSEHGNYLTKARKMIGMCEKRHISVNDAIEIFDMVNKV